MTKTIRIIVSGKVQGVSFRMYTRVKAREIGVCGYVRNLANGDVEIMATGDQFQLDKLINWAKLGSPLSLVKNLDVEIITNQVNSYKGFDIRYQ
jgi:acylphosphatase